MTPPREDRDHREHSDRHGDHGGSSYQVILQGELWPATLAFCAGPAAGHRTAKAFRLRMPDGQGIADLVARLQVAGLMILSIRQLTPAEAALAGPARPVPVRTDAVRTDAVRTDAARLEPGRPELIPRG
jgi:hypothetical protein